MGAPYNRNDLLGSMKVSMEAPSESASKSADDATTAGADASEKDDSAAAGSEGGDEGADENEGGDASGSEETDSDGTTAEDDAGASDEEQALEEDEEGEEADEDDESKADKKPEASAGKWDEEELKAAKEWGVDSLKPTAETKKLLKIARDNHAAVLESKQQLAVHNDYLAAVGNALVNHDIKDLNTMIQELGGEPIPFDIRSEEDQIKEVTDNFNAAYDALEAAKLPPEVWAQVEKALAPLHSASVSKVTALQEKLREKQLTEKVSKNLGQAPVKGKYMEALKGKADQNFAVLFKTDPKADKHMEILQPYFKMGTVLQNPSKAYAMAPKAINELGQALYFMKNFEKEFYPDIKKKALAEEKLKRIGKAPPSGNKGDSLGAGDTQNPKSGNNKFNAFAGKRLINRFGRGR